MEDKKHWVDAGDLPNAPANERARAVIDQLAKNHNSCSCRGPELCDSSGIESLPSLAERLRQALGKAIAEIDILAFSYSAALKERSADPYEPSVTDDMRALANGGLLPWTACKACDICGGKKCPAHPAYMRPNGTVLPRSVPAPMCGCDPVAGVVCQTCAMMAEKNVQELSTYVSDFITKRFPSGLKGDIRQIIAECILDAFHDGARWCEQQARNEALVINPGAVVNMPDAEPSKIIMATR